MKKALIKVGVIAALAAPLYVFAQTPLETFLETVQNVVNALLPIVTTLAIVFFFYGLALYILNAGNEEKKEEGKSIMIWGVLAIFVLLSIYGIVGFIQETTGVSDANTTVDDIETPGVVPGEVQ